MQDSYKWYNTALFHQREKLTENWPEVREEMEKNKQLKHMMPNGFSNAPQEEVKPTYLCNGADKEFFDSMKPSNHEKNIITSIQLTPEEENAFNQEDLQNTTDSNRDPNKFTQYGGWVLQGASRGNIDHSLYSIVKNPEDKEVVAIKMPGDQGQSCAKHLLFGHDLQVPKV